MPSQSGLALLTVQQKKERLDVMEKTTPWTGKAGLGTYFSSWSSFV